MKAHRSTIANPLKMPSSSPKPIPKPFKPSPMSMVELKTRILFSLSKLWDRDTHRIAIEDLEKTIKTLNPTPSTLPMLLNCLFADPHRETLRLTTLLAATHPSEAATHLPKMLSNIVRRLKDPAARDACGNAAGALAVLYITGEESGAVVGVFVRPLLEAMGEQSRTVQAGAAACLAQVVECGGCSDSAIAALGKLCPRVCRMVDGQGALARPAMLPVLAFLSQVQDLFDAFSCALRANA